jgi:hypothetical protein
VAVPKIRRLNREAADKNDADNDGEGGKVMNTSSAGILAIASLILAGSWVAAQILDVRAYIRMMAPFDAAS